MARTGEVTATVDAPADRVFAVLTDVARMPSWHPRMTAVVDAPSGGTLRAEGGWTAGWRVAGRRFTSRATVIEIDATEGRFTYRTTDETENPSFAIWSWRVEPEGAGRPGEPARCRVTLAWDLRPVTFVRKRVVSHLRSAVLARSEAAAIVAALSRRW